jgi:hypothetical protein
MAKFESYEIALVGRYCTTCDPENQHIERITEEYGEDEILTEVFWTLYGRLPNEEVMAVSDFTSFAACLQMYWWITGNNESFSEPCLDDFYVLSDLPS